MHTSTPAYNYMLFWKAQLVTFVSGGHYNLLSLVTAAYFPSRPQLRTFVTTRCCTCNLQDMFHNSASCMKSQLRDTLSFNVVMMMSAFYICLLRVFQTFQGTFYFVYLIVYANSMRVCQIIISRMTAGMREQAAICSLPHLCKENPNYFLSILNISLDASVNTLSSHAPMFLWSIKKQRLSKHQGFYR